MLTFHLLCKYLLAYMMCQTLFKFVGIPWLAKQIQIAAFVVFTF